MSRVLFTRQPDLRRLSHSYKSTYVPWIESAKKVETRERRIPDAIRMLREGRKQR
jgi:uncharacterized protein YdeI (YjbR/CyaY-like superfamily)